MRQDERQLQEVLYREYLTPLKRYAFRLGAGRDELEDLVHETFITYYERYPLDWPEDNRRKLLITILHNKWVDLCRRRKKGQELEEPHCGGLVMEESAGFGKRVLSPEEEIMDQELCHEVWTLIRDMKPNWRDVLALKLLEGMSNKEICEILGISEIVCRSRLSRAKRELKSRLEKAGTFQNCF